MATIRDLPSELWSIVMIMMVQSEDGGYNLARVLSVCRGFSKFSEDIHILKVVNFDNVRLSGRDHLFHKIKGLVNRCAQAGNTSAQFLLSKVLLISSSYLFKLYLETSGFYSMHDKHTVLKLIGFENQDDDAAVYSFVAHFMPGQASTSSALKSNLVHYQLAVLFMRRCSPHDLAEMSSHLSWYLKYFAGPECFKGYLVTEVIGSMHRMAIRIGSRNELRELKEIVVFCMRELREIDAKANEDDPSWQMARQEAHRRFLVLHTVLQFKCRKADVDSNIVFGRREEGELFDIYFEYEIESFEKCRETVVAALDNLI